MHNRATAAHNFEAKVVEQRDILHIRDCLPTDGEAFVARGVEYFDDAFRVLAHWKRQLAYVEEAIRLDSNELPLVERQGLVRRIGGNKAAPADHVFGSLAAQKPIQGRLD